MNIKDAITAAKSGKKIKRDAYESVIGFDGMDFRFWYPDDNEYGCRVVFTGEDRNAIDWHIYELERKHIEKTPEEIESYVKAKMKQFKQEFEQTVKDNEEASALGNDDKGSKKLLSDALIKIELLETETKYLKDKLDRVSSMLKIVDSVTNYE